MFSVHAWALVLELVGELLIAFSVVRVHMHMLKEHKLDRDVYKTIRREKTYVVIGIIMIVASTVIQIYIGG